jgi:hypothetical protein
MSYFAVLYCTVLCCTVLYYVALCCAVLCCTVLYCTVLCCVVLLRMLCCTDRNCTVCLAALCCAVFHYDILHNAAIICATFNALFLPHCTALPPPTPTLHYTTALHLYYTSQRDMCVVQLHCTVLYCTAVYFMILWFTALYLTLFSYRTTLHCCTTNYTPYHTILHHTSHRGMQDYVNAITDLATKFETIDHCPEPKRPPTGGKCRGNRQRPCSAFLLFQWPSLCLLPFHILLAPSLPSSSLLPSHSFS